MWADRPPVAYTKSNSRPVSFVPGGLHLTDTPRRAIIIKLEISNEPIFSCQAEGINFGVEVVYELFQKLTNKSRYSSRLPGRYTGQNIIGHPF